MAVEKQSYRYNGAKSITLVKWKVRSGSQLFYNTVMLNYKYDSANKVEAREPLLKYKSNVGGTVLQLLAAEGDVIQSGACLLEFQPCTHPVIMKDLCAECGTDLRDLDKDNFAKLTAAATFSMVHVVPELKVSLEQAEKLGRDDEDRLLKNRKLVLLVDLDQTLIHTTNDNVLPNLKDVYHFQLYGQYSPWYHTKLRPGTRKFLENISKYYELHICTFGARLYAHKIAQLLDPDGKLFSHRILSRDECFDATSKTGNLKALFPRGDAMVCIIDDREDVWNFAPNVVHVKPYCFFRNTGDINAPPSLQCKLDAKEVQPVKDTAFRMSEETASSATTSENLSSDMVNETVPSTRTDMTVPSTGTDVTEPSSGTDVTEPSSGTDVTTPSAMADKTVSGAVVDETVPGDVADMLMLSAVVDERVSSEKLSKKASSRIVGGSMLSATTKEKPQVDEKDTPMKETGSFNEAADADDYLLYLEEILVTVHKAYYDIYEQMLLQGQESIPDLKTVVPYVRQKVLKGTNVVFSSLIPTNCAPESSRFWTLATSLGAHVSRDLVLRDCGRRTTHVVASKLGTAKLNTAKKQRDVRIVSLDWLLCCAERWERADERLFPLRKEPDHSDGDTTRWLKRPCKPPTKSKRSKSEEDKFSERVFAEAGLSLSQEDIDDMDREVEEACSADDSDQNVDETSSAESLSSGDYPRCWKKKKRLRRNSTDVEEMRDSSSDVETIGSVDDEMAAAVEREFNNV